VHFETVLSESREILSPSSSTPLNPSRTLSQKTLLLTSLNTHGNTRPVQPLGDRNILTDVPGFVTNVPEPQTYAMLLAGLGLLGFMSRRSRQA
jgi:hypothetical protein